MIRAFKELSYSSLLKNSFIYIVCDGINKAIPFILLPFLTYYLSPSDYGIITNINVLIQLLSVFCYSATIGVLPVMYYKLDKEKMKDYISNVFLINSFVVLIFSVIILSLNSIIVDNLYISFEFQIISLLIVWLSSIININLTLWRCQEKALRFGLYQITNTSLNAFSTVFFVIILLLGWKGRIYSMFFSTIIFGLFSTFFLYKNGYIVYRFSNEVIKKILLFAIPLLPHALSFWVKSGVDKILLTEMCGLNENGLYSVSVTWGAIVGMFSLSFSNAYSPYLYKKLSWFDNNKEATFSEQIRIVKLIYSVILLSLIFVGLSYLFSYFFIKRIYEPSYYDSVTFLPYVMLGQFFNICYLLFVSFIHYTLKTKILGFITLTLSILQIILSYFFIFIWGAIGAAVSSAIISGLTFVFVAKYATHVYHLPWLLKNKI